MPELSQRIESLERQVNDMRLASQISHDSEQALRTRLDTPQSDVYTPTYASVANVDGTTASPVRYTRIGKTVIVSGSLLADPTTTATETKIGISLPIATRFTLVGDGGGTAVAASVAATECGAIYPDTTNLRMEMRFTATTASNHTIYFIFTYQIV